MIAACRRYHTRFYERLREIISSAELGRVASAHATFCIPIPPGRGIRRNLALGGGGLLDVGYYPVRVLTELFGESPTIKTAQAWTRGDINRRIDTTLLFAGAVTGEVVSSMWSSKLATPGLKVRGDEGRMRVSFPYHPQMGIRIRIDGRNARHVEGTDRRSTYAFQLEAFRDAVLAGTTVATDAAAAVA